MAPPSAALFSQNTVDATTETCIRTGTFPGGVSSWRWLVVKVSDGSIASNGATGGNSLNASALTTGAVYRGYVCWGDANGVRISDNTSLGTFTAGS